MPPDVTLEITVAPVDLPLAEHTLPHQLRQWSDQVTEIQFTLDLHRSRGRYGADAEARRPGLERLLQELCARYEHARVAVVDYGPDARRAVAERFFGGESVPEKHHYGGPVYSYFYGWHAASNDVVFHLDCDLLFGGGSRTWVEEAVQLLRANRDALLVSPFPGPPPDGGVLPPAALARHQAHLLRQPRRIGGDLCVYAFPGASTRLFLFDRAAFVEQLGPLPVERPRLRNFARAVAEGHTPRELPEITITRLMQDRDLWRFDFLGTPPGMWSLHPAMRSPEFYAALPELIRRVEEGAIPDEQRGDFDVNDSMVDWSSARAAARKQTWWRRVLRRPLR
jgi:hypothetical protein